MLFIVFVLVVGGLSLPFWRSLFYHHFGIMSNSDALYPFLFADDLRNFGQSVLQWNTPPSTYFFPDVVFFYFTSWISDSIEWQFLAWFCFVTISLYIWSRFFGLERYLAFCLSAFFFLLAINSPDQWGQVFLPGFHSGMILGFASLFKFSQKPFSWRISFILWFSLFLSSDLWFLPHIAIPFLVYRIFILRIFYVRDLLISGLIGLVTWFLFWIPKKLGVSVFYFSGVPISFHLPSWESFLLYCYSFGKVFLPDTPSLLLVLFLLGFGVILITVQQFKNNKTLVFCLFVIFFQFSFLCFYGIPPKIRYLVPSFLSFGGIFLWWLGRAPFLRGIVTFSFCLFFLKTLVHSEARDSSLLTLVTGKRQLESRISCFHEPIWNANWENITSDYWGAKYIRAFSEKKVSPLPVTDTFQYYPWIHNSAWDSEKKNGAFPIQVRSFMLRSGETVPQNLPFVPSQTVQICGDWKILSGP